MGNTPTNGHGIARGRDGGEELDAYRMTVQNLIQHKRTLTPTSSKTIRVQCQTCEMHTNDTRVREAHIRWRCVQCEEQFIETSSESVWELIHMPISAFCHRCNRVCDAAVLALCRECNQPATLIDDCPICWDSLPLLTHMSVLESCGHRFCNGCWGHHFSTAIRHLDLVPHGSSGFYSIQCPAEGCSNSPDDPHFVKRFVTAELYDRMKSFATENFAQLKLGAVTCPSPNCGSVMIPAARNSRVDLTCIDCKTRFCSRCRSLWHEGLTCQQFQAQSASSIPSASSTSSSADEPELRKCPNENCPMTIEKLKGTCNYMQCTYCKHEFCWLCLKPWPSDPTIFGASVPLHTFNYQKPCKCPKWGSAPS